MAHQKSPAHAHSSPSIYNLKKVKGQNRKEPNLISSRHPVAARLLPISPVLFLSLSLSVSLSPPRGKSRRRRLGLSLSGGKSRRPRLGLSLSLSGGRGSRSPSPAAMARALPLRRPWLVLPFSGGRDGPSSGALRWRNALFSSPTCRRRLGYRLPP